MNKEFDIRKFLLEDEEKLSPFAKKSSETLGRKFSIKNDPFRLEFARDETRILHSPPFRRLKHKTQVFLSPHNDHICTRMEHVLHVSSIAEVIGRCLNLNIDLINAIAKGHDLGHPPFGHAGERELDQILKDGGVENGFKHEIHGLRVVDKLTNHGAGLNLTWEVRDGITTHCGESFERVVRPDRKRDITQIETVEDRGCYPATLEGCLVRLVDRIAYLGRDLEDGIKAGLITIKDIPLDVAKYLGTDNGKMIGSFVTDTIGSSLGKDEIGMSEKIFSCMELLRDFNYHNIYKHPEVERKSRKAARLIRLLYEKLERILEKSDRGANSGYVQTVLKESPILDVFFNFIKNTNYNSSVKSWRIVTDYIAGMTDIFAERTFNQLFMPDPVI